MFRDVTLRDVRESRGSAIISQAESLMLPPSDKYLQTVGVIRPALITGI